MAEDDDPGGRRRTSLVELARSASVATYRRAVIKGLEPANVVVLVLDLNDRLATAFAAGLQPERYRQAVADSVMVTFASRQSLRAELGRIVPEIDEFLGRLPDDGHFSICCVCDGLELFSDKIPSAVFAGEA